jgi:hypothetical protein
MLLDWMVLVVLFALQWSLVYSSSDSRSWERSLQLTLSQKGIETRGLEGLSRSGEQMWIKPLNFSIPFDIM